jgi:hypothetical protein
MVEEHDASMTDAQGHLHLVRTSLLCLSFGVGVFSGSRFVKYAGVTGKCFECGGGYGCIGKPDCTQRNKKSKTWKCAECAGS